MTAVTPTLVMKKPIAYDNLSGSNPRRLVDVYIECSPAAGETLNISTFVPGFSSVVSITGTNLKMVSAPTFSDSTLTFVHSGVANGEQKVTLLGYY